MKGVTQSTGETPTGSLFLLLVVALVLTWTMVICTSCLGGGYPPSSIYVRTHMLVQLIHELTDHKNHAMHAQNDIRARESQRVIYTHFAVAPRKTK